MLPLRRCAPSPSLASQEGDDTFAARRLLLGASSLGCAPSRFCGLWLTGAFLCLSLSGCAVVAVTSTAVSVTAGAVGLAADAAIGTAKIVGKGVGKAADALMDDPKPDNSGINIRYREPGAAGPSPAPMASSEAMTTPVAPPAHLQPDIQ